MGAKSLISQLHSGELILAEQGERLVNHYSFYAVFDTPQEFRIIVKEGGRVLGSIPIESPVAKEQHIVFGGRRWIVLDVDIEGKTIFVSPSVAGKPPDFGGDGMNVHNLVRQEMLKLYLEGDYRIKANGSKVDFMDDTARRLFQEGLTTFQELKLATRRIVSIGKSVYLVPWMGDKIVNTLTILMVRAGHKANSFAGIIEVRNASLPDISECLKTLIEDRNVSNTDLARLIEEKRTKKYDHLLPEILLVEGYGAKAFDVNGTFEWLSQAIRLNLLQSD